VLESYIRKRLEESDILLMTHIVLGYPISTVIPAEAGIQENEIIKKPLDPPVKPGDDGCEVGFWPESIPDSIRDWNDVSLNFVGFFKGLKYKYQPFN
jgi:hypothetical protein